MYSDPDFALPGGLNLVRPTFTDCTCGGAGTSGGKPCGAGLGSHQNLGVESGFRPRKRMSSFFLLKRGVQILCLFSQNQTPRSDSANLEPSEPIFCPQILEPRLGLLVRLPGREQVRGLLLREGHQRPRGAGLLLRLQLTLSARQPPRRSAAIEVRLIGRAVVPLQPLQSCRQSTSTHVERRPADLRQTRRDHWRDEWRAAAAVKVGGGGDFHPSIYGRWTDGNVAFVG